MSLPTQSLFGLSLVLVAAAMACAPTTSSSTHWLQCSEFADCASTNAVDCQNGYCIDVNGNRIDRDTKANSGGSGSGTAATAAGAMNAQGGESARTTALRNQGGQGASVSVASTSLGLGGVPGSGGSTGSSATALVGGANPTTGGSSAVGSNRGGATNIGGGAGSGQAGNALVAGGFTSGVVSGGASSKGGANSSAGASNRGGTSGTAGANNGGAAGQCLTTDFVNSLKDCNADTDCEKVRYQVNCCGTNAWLAVRTDRMAELSACLATRPAFPLCGCASMGDTVEDGRFVSFNGSDVVARCVNRRCQSRVAGRSCGVTNPVTCTEGQLCVAYQSTIGPTSTVDYACAANPCSDQLDCSCAQSLCNLRTDTTRTCYQPYGAGTTTFVDVGCQDNRQ